jgi:thiamine monophosphate synthase
MRSIIIALAAGVTLSAGAAYAQSIHIGPDGVQLRDRDRYEYRSNRRGYDDDDMTTGAIRRGCRTVVIREQDEYGDEVTRRVRRCR